MEQNLGRVIAAFFTAAERADRKLKIVEIDYHYDSEYGIVVAYFSIDDVEMQADIELKKGIWHFEAPVNTESSTRKNINPSCAAKLFAATGIFLKELSETSLEGDLEMAYEGYYDCIKNYHKLGT